MHFGVWVQRVYAFLLCGRSVSIVDKVKMMSDMNLGGDKDGTAAASAAAFARPWSASMGASMIARGRVSSSSSEEGAVLGTMP